MQTCFTHPGWECEEITKKREEIAKAEGTTLPAMIPVKMEPGNLVMDQFSKQVTPNVQLQLIVDAAAEDIAETAEDAAQADYQDAAQAAERAVAELAAQDDGQTAQVVQETAQAAGAQEEFDIV